VSLAVGEAGRGRGRGEGGEGRRGEGEAREGEAREGEGGEARARRERSEGEDSESWSQRPSWPATHARAAGDGDMPSDRRSSGIGSPATVLNGMTPAHVSSA
jgi:hypothetical protein